jgi:hypothetical protein
MHISNGFKFPNKNNQSQKRFCVIFIFNVLTSAAKDPDETDLSLVNSIEVLSTSLESCLTGFPTAAAKPNPQISRTMYAR